MNDTHLITSWAKGNAAPPASCARRRRASAPHSPTESVGCAAFKRAALKHAAFRRAVCFCPTPPPDPSAPAAPAAPRWSAEGGHSVRLLAPHTLQEELKLDVEHLRSNPVSVLAQEQPSILEGRVGRACTRCATACACKRLSAGPAHARILAAQLRHTLLHWWHAVALLRRATGMNERLPRFAAAGADASSDGPPPRLLLD